MTWLIIVLVVVGILVLLALGGALAGSRVRQRRSARFQEQLAGADRALAAARASDRGWDRTAIEDAARQAVARERPEVAVLQLVLVQVVDRPGTDEDRVMLHAVHAGGVLSVTLGRVRGEWTPEAVRERR
jgi:type II secretory pathway pseudopilin PulG